MILVAVVVQVLAGASVGQPTDAAGADIVATYDFSPHLLTSEEITQKSQLLDAFWKRAEADPASYVPALRHALRLPDSSPFFLYDGSMLLLRLSDTEPDRKSALAAIARCDLRDVQSTAYLRSVHRLAVAGENTTAAALHVLQDPEFQAFIPQHVLTLGQDYSLVYMLLPTDPKFWLQPAVERLRTEKDATAQRSLLLLLWYAQESSGDAALLGFATDLSKPEENRAYAEELLSRNKDPRRLSMPTAMSQTDEVLRAERRETMRRLSDEALIELDRLTMKIAAKRR